MSGNCQCTDCISRSSPGDWSSVHFSHFQLPVKLVNWPAWRPRRACHWQSLPLALQWTSLRFRLRRPPATPSESSLSASACQYRDCTTAAAGQCHCPSQLNLEYCQTASDGTVTSLTSSTALYGKSQYLRPSQPQLQTPTERLPRHDVTVVDH